MISLVKKRILKKIFCFLIPQIFLSETGQSDQPRSIRCEPKWNAETRLRLKATTVRYLGQIELFAPLLQNNTSLFFSDIRLFRDSKSNTEGNFGLAYRKLNPSLGWIFGGYGFFDRRRSEVGNTFNQTTLGVEALSEIWDYRTNIYIPLSHSKAIPSHKIKRKKTIYRGHTEYFNTQKEIPLKGIDVEIGRRIPYIDAIRFYVAGYHFQNSGTRKINGIRTRLEWSLNDHFSVDAAYQYDNVRHSVPYIGCTVRIPFGGESNLAKLNPLERRMQEDIIRDIDIVTKTKESFRPNRNFIVGSPGAKGNGTFESPADANDPEALAKLLAANPSFHYYDLGSGTIMTGQEKIRQLRQELLVANVNPIPAQAPVIPVQQNEANRNSDNKKKPPTKGEVIALPNEKKEEDDKLQQGAKEEEERNRKEELKRQEEEKQKRKEEKKRKQEAAEKKLKEEEVERKRLQDLKYQEELRLQAEKEKKKREQEEVEKKHQEELKRQEEEQRRQEAEKKRLEDERRSIEEKRKKDEEEKKSLEEERRKQEQLKRQEEEQARQLQLQLKKDEEERQKKIEEEEKKRKQDDELKQQQMALQKKLENEQQKREEELKRQEEERKRQEEEDQKRKEEELKHQEQVSLQKLEAEKRKKEEDLKRQKEEEEEEEETRVAKEAAEKKRQEELTRQKEEEEKAELKRKEEERKRQEEARIAEERRQEAEKKRKEEEERQRKEKEKKQLEDEKARKLEEKRKQEEAEKQRQEELKRQEERRQKAEEEKKKRLEEEEKLKQEELKRKEEARIAEEKLKQQEELKRKEAEEKARITEERRQEAEKKRKEEQERRRKEEEKKRLEEEKARKLEEKRQQEEADERKRKEEEARAAEERRKEADEKKRKEEEEARAAEEKLKQQKELKRKEEEEEKLKQEELKRQEDEKHKRLEEEEKLKQEGLKRILAEEKRQEELKRQEEAKKKRQEDERRVLEEKRINDEKALLKALEQQSLKHIKEKEERQRKEEHMRQVEERKKKDEEQKKSNKSKIEEKKKQLEESAQKVAEPKTKVSSFPSKNAQSSPNKNAAFKKQLEGIIGKGMESKTPTPQQTELREENAQKPIKEQELSNKDRATVQAINRKEAKEKKKEEGKNQEKIEKASETLDATLRRGMGDALVSPPNTLRTKVTESSEEISEALDSYERESLLTHLKKPSQPNKRRPTNRDRKKREKEQNLETQVIPTSNVLSPPEERENVSTISTARTLFPETAKEKPLLNQKEEFKLKKEEEIKSPLRWNNEEAAPNSLTEEEQERLEAEELRKFEEQERIEAEQLRQLEEKEKQLKKKQEEEQTPTKIPLKLKTVTADSPIFQKMQKLGQQEIFTKINPSALSPNNSPSKKGTPSKETEEAIPEIGNITPPRTQSITQIVLSQEPVTETFMKNTSLRLNQKGVSSDIRYLDLSTIFQQSKNPSESKNKFVKMFNEVLKNNSEEHQKNKIKVDVGNLAYNEAQLVNDFIVTSFSSVIEVVGLPNSVPSSQSPSTSNQFHKSIQHNNKSIPLLPNSRVEERKTPPSSKSSPNYKDLNEVDTPKSDRSSPNYKDLNEVDTPESNKSSPNYKDLGEVETPESNKSSPNYKDLGEVDTPESNKSSPNYKDLGEVETPESNNSNSQPSSPYKTPEKRKDTK